MNSYQFVVGGFAEDHRVWWLGSDPDLDYTSTKAGYQDAKGTNRQVSLSAACHRKITSPTLEVLARSDFRPSQPHNSALPQDWQEPKWGSSIGNWSYIAAYLLFSPEQVFFRPHATSKPQHFETQWTFF